MARQPTMVLLADQDEDGKIARRLLVDRSLPFKEVSSGDLKRPAGYSSPTLFVWGRAYEGLELIKMVINTAQI